MSLRSEMESHPERFPNLTWKKARPGSFSLIFLKKIPKASSNSSPRKPEQDTKSKQ
jgi:hypothetical protein